MKQETKRLLRIGIFLFLLYLCIRYWGALIAFLGTVLSAASPLIVGAVVAYLINIIMSFYERHWFPKTKHRLIVRTRRLACLLLALLSMAGIVFLVGFLVLPPIWEAASLLISEIPGYMYTVVDWLETRGLLPDDVLDSLKDVDWRSQLTGIIGYVVSGVFSAVGVAVGVVTSIFSGLFSALLAFIFALYLLFGKERLGRQCKRVMERFIKPKALRQTYRVLGVCNDCFHKYIVGQCAEALIIGALCTAGMLILRFPYATMVGALVAFTALIPVAGAYIGAGVGAFLIFTVDPMKAVFFLIFIGVLQQLEGNLIYPRVVGSSIGLPGIWVLAAVTVGGGVLGIPGMFLGVPLAAAAYRLLGEELRRKDVGAISKEEPPVSCPEEGEGERRSVDLAAPDAAMEEKDLAVPDVSEETSGENSGENSEETSEETVGEDISADASSGDGGEMRTPSEQS